MQPTPLNTRTLSTPQNNTRPLFADWDEISNMNYYSVLVLPDLLPAIILEHAQSAVVAPNRLPATEAVSPALPVDLVGVDPRALAPFQDGALLGKGEGRALSSGGGDVDVISGNVDGILGIVGEDDVLVGFGLGNDAVVVYGGDYYSGGGALERP